MAGEDILSQLTALKAERDRIAGMPDDVSAEAPALAAQPASFGEGFSESGLLGFGGKLLAAPFKAAYGIGNLLNEGSKTFAANPNYRQMPLGTGVIPAIAEHLIGGRDTPLSDQLINTGKVIASPLPGSQTGIDAIFSDKSNYELGKELNDELANYGGVALTGMGVAAARTAKLNSATRAAAAAAEQEAYLNNPSTQAAMRLAENYDPNLITPTIKDSLWKGQVSPELEGVVNANQQRINNLSGVPGETDYLPGVAMGYPENNAGMSTAASETMAKAGPALLDSGAYTAGDAYNPITGKFEGPPNPSLNSQTFANKLETASTQIIGTRRTIAENLDLAAQTISREKGINLGSVDFATDITPALGELGEVIAKRDMLAQTGPISQSMKDALAKTKFSFERLKNRNHGEKTPVSISETLSILEDMNAFRRSLGEFDEAAVKNGLNSTHNDFAGRAAELYATGKVQEAIQSAFESKASQILDESKGIQSQQPWQQVLSQVTKDTLPTMNKNYGAFQTANEAAVTYSNTTRRGLVAQEPGRLNTNVQQAGTGERVANANKGGFLDKAGRAWDYGAEKLGFKRPQDPVNPSLDRLNAINARPDAAISQVLDGLLLREKPVPVLSRDWKNVKADPAALQELNNRGVMLGLIAVGQFEQLSDPMRQQLHKAVASINPQGMEQYPGGLNVTNGQFVDPMEKDYFVKENLYKSAADRYRNIAPTFEGNAPATVIPQAAKPAAMPQAPGLTDLNSILGPILNRAPAGMPASIRTPIEQQLDDAIFRHSEDYIR